MLIALAIAFVLCAAIALTLARMQLRMLRFITLIPVLVAVAAVLKLGASALDQSLSARPLVRELSSVETHPLPVAVCGVSRDLEYGLAFYRNQSIARYEAGIVPTGEHLLVAAPSAQDFVYERTVGRHITFLGHYAPQDVNYYWVAPAIR